MMRSALHSSRVLSRVARPNNGLRFMSKEIKFGVDGRAAMLKGVDTLADAVQVSKCSRYPDSSLYVDFVYTWYK